VRFLADSRPRAIPVRYSAETGPSSSEDLLALPSAGSVSPFSMRITVIAVDTRFTIDCFASGGGCCLPCDGETGAASSRVIEWIREHSSGSGAV
jgi:hypothetical protein